MLSYDDEDTSAAIIYPESPADEECWCRCSQDDALFASLCCSVLLFVLMMLFFQGCSPCLHMCLAMVTLVITLANIRELYVQSLREERARESCTAEAKMV
jgi:hypothetical protein